MTTLVVIAKECRPGHVKTRLHPPYSLAQAAELAEACLDDTLESLSALAVDRRVLYFDGVVPPRSADGWEIVPQSEGPLDERIAHVFDLCSGPTLLVGMDTPHLDADWLEPIAGAWPADVDAWFGASTDGGFWALALRAPRGALVRGVPMSRDDTGEVQLRRLRDAGLNVRMLPELTDVDTAADLGAAALGSPRLHRALRAFDADRMSVAS